MIASSAVLRPSSPSKDALKKQVWRERARDELNDDDEEEEEEEEDRKQADVISFIKGNKRDTIRALIDLDIDEKCRCSVTEIISASLAAVAWDNEEEEEEELDV